MLARETGRRGGGGACKEGGKGGTTSFDTSQLVYSKHGTFSLSHLADSGLWDFGNGSLNMQTRDASDALIIVMEQGVIEQFNSSR